METIQQAAFFFVLPWAIGFVVMAPVVLFISIGRRLQEKKLQQAYKEEQTDY